MNAIRVFPAVLILALAAFPMSGDDRERDVDDLVSEFVADDTSEERRAELLAALKDQDPAELERPLSRALRKKNEVKPALTLAAELRLPGLGPQVLRLVNEHPKQALNYLFKTPDERTERLLVRRWHSEDLDGEVFSALHQQMLSNWISLERLKEFRTTLDDEARGEPALEILRFQMLDDSASADDLKRDWEDRVEDLSHRAKRFDLERRPLFDLDWDLDAATSIRVNYSLSAGRKAFLKGIPDDWQTKNFNIRLRICPNEAERMQFQIYSDPDGVVAFEFEDGFWQFRLESGDTPKIPASAQEWSELEFRITNKQSDKDPHERICVMLVNGNELKSPTKGYLLNGKLTDLTVQVMSGGEAYFGGGEWWYDD